MLYAEILIAGLLYLLFGLISVGIYERARFPLAHCGAFIEIFENSEKSYHKCLKEAKAECENDSGTKIIIFFLYPVYCLLGFLVFIFVPLANPIKLLKFCWQGFRWVKT